MKTVKENGQLAVVAKRQLAKLGTDEKNNILAVCAKALRDNAEFIVGENAKDMENAKNKPVLFFAQTLKLMVPFSKE